MDYKKQQKKNTCLYKKLGYIFYLISSIKDFCRAKPGFLLPVSSVCIASILFLNLWVFIPGEGLATGTATIKDQENISLKIGERLANKTVLESDETEDDTRQWNKFEADSFELQLPVQWEGGGQEDFDSIIKELNEKGHVILAHELELAKPWMLFWAYDVETPLHLDIVTTINIAMEPDIPLVLKDFMQISYESVEQDFKSMGYEYSIIKQEIIPMAGFMEVGRTVYEVTILTKCHGVQYIIEDNSDFWILTFTTEDELDKYIDIFDGVVENFVLN